MTTWRHTQHDDAIPGCDVEVRRDIDPATWWLEPCGCQTPTPDPASPCEYVYEWGPSLPCKAASTSTRHDERVGSRWHHPHVPTRCTCGHPIEEAIR